MSQKRPSQLILMVIAGAVLVLGGVGFWYYQQSANRSEVSAPTEQPSQAGQTAKTSVRDDFGCWPPSCSVIPDPQGKQMCVDWKAGKTVQWPECKYFSDQPACVKLCELEKKAGTQSGSPQTTSTPAQKQVFSTLPSLVKGEFASVVSQEDKNFIIQGIATMDFYLQKWFSKSTNKSSGLKVGANASADMGSSAQVVVENGLMTILIETGGAFWDRQIQSNKEIGGEWRPRIPAHEYVHVYQFQNGCGAASSESPLAPKWFIEGEAEWLSYKATKEAGLLPPLTIPQLVIPQAKQVKGSLQSFENPTGLDFSAYFLYTMGIDYLMKDKPIKALDDFCANLGNGMGRTKSFETAFGITKEKFYEGFEAYRKTW